MTEDLGLPQEYNIPADLPGEELNARIDPVEGYLPARPDALDTYRNVTGNPLKGSNPAPSYMDFEKGSDNRLKKLIETPHESDQYDQMRPFTYSGDYDAANFDRYYGTKAYKTLGFSPYRDNESLYNNKMTMGDQFVRSFGQWDNLLWNGMKGNAKTWGDIFTDPLAPDIQSAKDMQRSIAIGSNNTGGVAGFMGNTALNLMYGMGMGLEFIAEEAALAAATAFTGGALGEATAPAMLSRGAMFAKNLGKIGEMGAKLTGKTAEYGKSFEKGMDAFRKAETAAELSKNIAKTEGGIDNVNSARNFYNKAVSGAFDFINPFEETFSSLKSTQYANNYAKTIGSAGAFIDDIMRIKMAAAEAKNEGGMVQIDATKKLIDQYRDENGKDPAGEDLAKIETLARLEGEKTVLYNYPAILATNKLLFATILYPLKKIKGGNTGKLIETAVAEDGVKATSQNIFKKLGTNSGAQIRAAAKSLLKPKVYGTYGMSYLKANVGEGVQENIQEAISQGAIEHALAVQSDPAMAAYQGHMGYIMHGIEDQFSAQGAETFASGFLMGMFQQPIMTAPTWALSKGIERLKSKEVRDEIRKKRDEAADNEVNTLNNLFNNDINYWFGDAVTTVKNNALNTDMINQASIGDVKGARDSQFALEFNHMAALNEGGRFELAMDKLKDYKNLSPAEALAAFKAHNIGIETEEEAVAAQKHIDSVVDRAYRIKDQFQEVASKFPNYFNLSAVKPNTPEYTAMAISYKAWQEAQRNLVFAKSAYDEYARRTKGLVDDFSALSSQIAKTDSQTLQSVMTLPNLKMEIDTLKRELSALGDVEGQGEVKRDKQKKLDLLKNFQESVLAAQDKIASENITDHVDKQSVYGQAKKDFQKLLTYLAKRSDTIHFDENTDKAFGILTDNLEMRDQMQGLAHSINVLNSPKGFLHVQSRIFEALDKAARSDDRVQRIRENIYKFHAMNDENEIINSLGKLGLKIPDEFIEEYKKALEKGQKLPTPDHYIDPSTGKEVDYMGDGDRYLKADELWQAFKYWMEETRIKTPEELAKEKKNAEDALLAMQFDPKVVETFPPILAENLMAMHLADIESGSVAKDQTLKEYVETNPKALQEIKLYKMQTADQTNWSDLIKNAVSEKELNAVMDQMTKLNAMTPDLLDYIIKRKQTDFPEVVEATPVNVSPVSTVEETIQEPPTTEKPKKGKIIEGSVYTAPLSAGRAATFNPETGNWDFMTKTGRLIKDKETVDKLAKELSNQGDLVMLWVTRWLSPAQRVKMEEDLEQYQRSQNSETTEGELELAVFLMNELSGTKFNPKSLKGQVTDIHMSSWTKKDSKNEPDTFISEEDLKNLGIKAEDIVDKIYALINKYPKGITATDIKEVKETYLTKNNKNKVLQDAFINTYGIDPDIAYKKMHQGDFTDIVYDETDLSVGKKFNIAVKELENHKILEGILTMDASTQIVDDNKTYDLGENYVYQVTLLDGRTFPVTSDYNFDSAIPADVYKNKPSVRLVLTEFNGKPAVEVRLMEPGYMDQRLTYVREKEPKFTKPSTNQITQADVENSDIFYHLDMTLEEMNANISKPVLVVAKYKGYDAIYQNIPYLITRVDEKTVSLKSIDGKVITANITDITEIRDGKEIIKSKIDAEIAKINQAAAGSVLTSLDDDISLGAALNSIKTNKC